MRLPQLTGFFRHLLGRASRTGFIRVTKPYNAPHLLDLEVTQVLRRLALQGVVAVHRADEAVRDLLDLRITRYPHLVLLPRIWQLRHNFSAYDAAYIVLAEKLGGTLVYTGWSTRFCFRAMPQPSSSSSPTDRITNSPAHPLIVDPRGAARP